MFNVNNLAFFQINFILTKTLTHPSKWKAFSHLVHLWPNQGYEKHCCLVDEIKVPCFKRNRKLPFWCHWFLTVLTVHLTVTISCLYEQRFAGWAAVAHLSVLGDLFWPKLVCFFSDEIVSLSILFQSCSLQTKTNYKNRYVKCIGHWIHLHGSG